MAGKSAIRPMAVPEYQKWAPVAGAVPDFDMQSFLSRKQIADTDRFTQLALIATIEAMTDAGFEPNDANPFASTGMGTDIDGERVGIALGSAIGGVQSLEAGALQLAASATGRTSPRLVSKSIPNAAAGSMAMRWGIQGPVLTYATACASSANAIGEAAYWLRAGEVDVVLAGGAECLFTPSILAGLGAAGALAKTGPADVSQWSRPFDRNRQGMVMGEGAAVLVLETWEHAVRRGARIYAELVGYGTSNDAYHETAPHPDGRGAVLAMQRALRSAQLAPTDVDYINAHATSTPAGDAAEGKALRSIFGDALQYIPVSSIKGAIGHMLGVAGAVESVASVLSIHNGWLPPTLHCENPDECAPPDIIPGKARNQPVQTVLSNSFGFGGQNAALVWAQPE